MKCIAMFLSWKQGLKINLFKLYIMTFFLILLTNTAVMQVYAEPYSKINDKLAIDKILRDYINSTTKDNTSFIDSTFNVNSVQISNPKSGFKKNIDDKIKYSIYTFKNADNIEPIYDTYIDYYFTDKMIVKNNDKLTVEVSDFLRPISPIDSKMYTKSNINDEWKWLKAPQPVMTTLQSFTLEGDELTNHDNFTRVIIHFSSYSNDHSKENSLPNYFLQYTHDTSTYITFPLIYVMVSLLIILLLAYLFIKRLRSRSSR